MFVICYLSTVNAVSTLQETRASPASVQTTAVVPRPSILRKRDIEGFVVFKFIHYTTFLLVY
jgi:hypothetical protein